MRFTLIVSEHKKRWHDHFFTESQLYSALDEIHKLNGNGVNYKFFTFSRNGSEEASNDSEVILTVIDDDKILCPASCGGTWWGYDQHRNSKRNHEESQN